MEAAMYHITYAQLNSEFSVPRLECLVKALEHRHCKVDLNLLDMRLDVEIPDEQMWWVLTGCITVFFEDFKDVASWSFRFTPTASKPLAA
jgi:hypothetical protein